MPYNQFMNTENTTTQAEAQTALESINIISPGALPVALKLSEIGNVREIVNRSVCWDSSKAKVEPGVLAEILVASLLCGERPLYRIQELWTHQGFPPYLEKHGVSVSQLNDDAFEYLLDRIAEADGQKIVEAVAMEFMAVHEITIELAHGDTSSVSVEGAYEDDTEGNFTVTYGHSKDHRPDLKQIKLGLFVQQEGLPFSGEMLSGNTSDKKWNPQAVEYAAQLVKEHGYDESIFVSDSALVSGKCLRSLAEKDIDFISLLPGTFSLEKMLKDQACKESAWIDLEIPGYRAFSTTGEIEGSLFDFLVISSEKLGKRKEKSLADHIAREQKGFTKKAEQLHKETFACEADAQKAMRKLMNTIEAKGYTVTGSLHCEEKPLRRPGRPKKDGIPEMEQHWKALVTPGELREDIYKQRLQRESTFVLVYRLENHQDRKNPGDILDAYKNQNTVEQGFRFLKQPVYLGPIFLKKPGRIKALGYIFFLVLLVAKYLEYRVRLGLKRQDKRLIRGGSEMLNPSTKSILDYLKILTVLQLGNQYRMGIKNRNAILIMEALGFDWNLYTHGNCEDTFMERQKATRE